MFHAFAERSSLPELKNLFMADFFNAVEEDVTRAIHSRDLALLRNIFLLIGTSKNKYEIEPTLLKAILDLCRKEEKNSQGEIKAFLETLNSRNQENTKTKPKGGQGSLGSKLSLISRLDY